MRLCTIAFIFGLLLLPASTTRAQMNFADLPSYCNAMSEASSSTLMARAQNLPRTQLEAMMQGMTDPKSVRMVKEVIDFAYARPASAPMDTLRSELRNLCLAKKIFVQ